MNMARFYRVLRSLRRKGYKPFFSTWTSIRLQKNGRCFCPITAAYHSRTRIYLSEADVDLAANKLGMRRRDKDQVMSHADGRSGITRQRVIKALKLEKAECTRWI